MWVRDRHPRERAWWWVQRVFLGVFLLVLAIAVILPVGAFVDDRRIAADPVRTTAVVDHVSRTRAAVTFSLEDGTPFSPPAGVGYPVGLREGQHVVVEYSRDAPEVVRVQGRGWTLSLLPAASLPLAAGPVLLLGWVIAGRLRLRSRRGRGAPIRHEFPPS